MTNGHNLFIHVHREDEGAGRAHERKHLNGVTVHVRDANGNDVVEAPVSSDRGRIEVYVPPGVVSIVPDEAWQDGAHTLVTPWAAGVIVTVEEGKGLLCEIPYHPRRATLRVVPGMLASASTFATPPPSPLFTLYSGMHVAPEALLRQQSHGEFSNLPVGHWTLVAEFGPAFTPDSITRTFHVADDRDLDLSNWFEFHPVVGTVSADVVSGATPVDGARIVLTDETGRMQYADTKSGSCQFTSVPVGAYAVSLERSPFQDSTGSTWDLVEPGQICNVVLSASSASARVQFAVQPMQRYNIALTDPHGNRHRHALVDIFDMNRQFVAEVALDGDGKGMWLAPDNRKYFFAPKAGRQAPLQPVPQN
jgi:hypothetical protein